jgi:hypothetical protein
MEGFRRSIGRNARLGIFRNLDSNAVKTAKKVSIFAERTFQACYCYNVKPEIEMGKYILISGSVILLVIVLSAIMAFGKTQQQAYQVVYQDKDFEIRFYPSSILATVHMDVQSYSEMSGKGFRKLAGYIFGGNESGTKISMTAPVHMDITNKGSSMSFVMPSSWKYDQLPKPNDAGVIIENKGDEYVAAIRFGGYASDASIQEYSGKLKALLEAKGIKWYGDFRFLGYNPPFQPVFRRNEIIVSVYWNKSQQQVH